MNNLKIGVVILNWNNVPDTIKCILSVCEQTYENRELIVVDNGSGDDSVSRLQQRFPDLTIIANGRNLGYAGGNNIGIKFLLKRDIEAILILNNDVVLESSALLELTDTLNQDDAIKVVAPVTLTFDEPPKVIESGARFNPYNGSQTRLYQGANPKDIEELPPFDIDIAPGCAFLAHRDSFGEVGYLPEHYFLYYEETEWCLDVKRSGYRVVCQPKALVRHKNSSTIGFDSPLVTYYLTRNQFYLYRKHLLRSTVHQIIVFSIIREFKRILVDILSGRTIHAYSRVQGLLDFIRGRTGFYPGNLPREEL
ncbi:MAG: glycosyltransferase family 2 protein [Candidatus Kariarchaeaceae archaeon]